MLHLPACIPQRQPPREKESQPIPVLRICFAFVLFATLVCAACLPAVGLDAGVDLLQEGEQTGTGTGTGTGTRGRLNGCLPTYVSSPAPNIRCIKTNVA